MGLIGILKWIAFWPNRCLTNHKNTLTMNDYYGNKAKDINIAFSENFKGIPNELQNVKSFYSKALEIRWGIG